MSQIEQEFTLFLSKHPELRKCLYHDLINKRQLTRFFIERENLSPNKFEAVNAMIRRFSFKKKEITQKSFENVKISLKNNIAIIGIEKVSSQLHKIPTLFEEKEYLSSATFKFVVGTKSIKLFVDEEMIPLLPSNITIQNKRVNLSELSLIFPKSPSKNQGTLSTVTQELANADINIEEVLTSSPELLIYLREEDSIKALQVIKRLTSKK